MTSYPSKQHWYTGTATAHKQAADSPVGRLLTRAVLYRSCVARF